MTGRPSPAVQDYLKAAYRLSQDAPEGAITTSRVADALAVTPASASNMLKRLDGLGYVQQLGRGEFRLTPAGRAGALEVLRHHRLLETFLVERVGVPLEEAHREAEILEHHLSEELEARIADLLGHPDRDPHGDPIPSLEGDVAEVAGAPLSRLGPGSSGTVVRVSDRDPGLLRFLAGAGLVPDALVHVVGAAAGGAVRVRVEDATVDVPADAAAAVFVAAG
ncbi:MAG: metal-dependent transcriptional regulator [Thermoleophilia bacterium]|nr:metal-dependent transcriptional regulator [Thermoleophilia bacterium]